MKLADLISADVSKSWMTFRQVGIWLRLRSQSVSYLTRAVIWLSLGRDSGSLVTHEMGLPILGGEGFLPDLSQEFCGVIQRRWLDSLLNKQKLAAKSGIASRCGTKFYNFSLFYGGGQQPFDLSLNFSIFLEKAKRNRTFWCIIFEKDLLKGFFRKNKINYEVLQLSAGSRYLWSVAHKIPVTSPNNMWKTFSELQGESQYTFPGQIGDFIFSTILQKELFDFSGFFRRFGPPRDIKGWRTASHRHSPEGNQADWFSLGKDRSTLLPPKSSCLISTISTIHFFKFLFWEFRFLIK